MRRWLGVAFTIAIASMVVVCYIGTLLSVIAALIAVFLGDIGDSVQLMIMAALYMACARFIVWGTRRMYERETYGPLT